MTRMRTNGGLAAAVFVGGCMAGKKTKRVLRMVGKELQRNPPAVLAKTRAKKGPAAAERRRRAILLSKARKRGARVAKR